ncbi:glycosyltransferase [Segatella bryantii]|uniref:glycosyltransferase n=1 Tax=Segatella bryantii TaxID=77095 RepID=UPI00241F61F6|nr:glycosyltransferase [Segatella bryantii]
MKILHISKYYYPFLGGVENICKDLVEHMPQHRTSVVCFSDDKVDKVDEVNGHRVYRIGSLVNIARQSLSTSYKDGLKWAILSEQPDIIHFHWANPFPAFLLRMIIPANVKLIVHWHMDIVRQWYLYWAVKPWEKWLIRRADRIIVTSPQYRDASKPLKNVKDKVNIVPNCIEEEKLILKEGDESRIIEIKKKYDEKPIIFFMGRHTKYKGLTYLIEAEKYLQAECVIVIAGFGELTNKLERQVVNNNQKRIHFVGKLSEKDLRCYLHAASIFAFPSVTRNEAFGVALAEAMYCGIPAVTFTIHGSGVNWVNLDRVTGIEVPNRDCKSYAKALDKLLDDDLLRMRYGRAAHERVKNNFLLCNMIDAMDKIYKDLI